jgi:hypothetical protein
MPRLLSVALVLASSAIAPAEDPVPELADILKRAEPLRPAARDLVWRQIPWYADPAEALQKAKDEGRPLFVWLAGGRDRDGSPLERC